MLAGLLRKEPVPLPDLEGRMPVLDGLRGLAILLVIIVHWNQFQLTGNRLFDIGIHMGRVGWIGVDLFFTISGFLITGILLRTKESPNYFKSFYMRRILRIFPLYYAFLFMILVLVPWSGLFEKYNNFWLSGGGGHQWYYWVFLSNYSEGIGYTRHRFLVITWSLAVEEHFYLIWPLIVYRYSTSMLKKICIGCIVVPLFLRLFFIDIFGGSITLIGFLTPFRIDPIATGALLAILVREGPQRLAQLRRWSGIFLPFFIAGTIFFGVLQEWFTVVDGAYAGQYSAVVTWGFTCFALLFGTLLIYTLLSGERNWIRQVLLTRPFLILGKYSYAIYLFHIPVHFASVRITQRHLDLPTGIPDWRWIICYLLSSFLTLSLAWLSWNLLEKPFLGLKERFRY